MDLRFLLNPEHPAELNPFAQYTMYASNAKARAHDNVFTIDELGQAKEKLREIGFVGIDLPRGCPVSAQDFIDWESDLVDQFPKHVSDKGVWKGVAKKLVVPKTHGIIKGFGIGQSPPMWEVRDWLYKLGIFQEILGTRELRVSMDSANIYNPNPKARYQPIDWLHRDQYPNNPDFKGVQGVVEFLWHDGGLAVVPGSHLRDVAHLKRGSSHFTKIADDMKQNLELVICPPRDRGLRLWLWDSRTWHANKRAESGKRVAAYVTFDPIDPTVTTKQREDLVRQGATTSHDPNTKRANPPPRYYDVKDTNIPPTAKGKVIAVKDLPGWFE